MSSLPARLYAARTERWPNQEDAYNLSVDLDAAFLAMKPGLGKTKVAADTAGTWWQRGLIDTMVVIAPNGVHRKWISRELPKHWGKPAGNMRWLGAAWKAQMRVAERATFEDAALLRSDPNAMHVLAFNAECVSGGAGLEMLETVLKHHGSTTLFIVDEGQRFKNPSASRTKKLLKLRALARVRRVLSGTPIGTGYENLFAPYYFLDPDIIGVRTYTEFRAWFCVERKFDRFSKIVGYRQIDRLMKLIAPITVFQDYSVVKLPPRVTGVRDIVMGDEQRRLYTTLRDEYLVELEGGAVVTAKLAITRLQRLQQILSGFLPQEDGTIQTFPNPRLDDLMEELDNRTDAKTVIWCRWRYDVNAIAAALAARDGHPNGYARYYGELSQAECDTELLRFVDDPACKVFLVTPSKGAEGLNEMVVARYEIWYTHTFSFIQYEQGCKRVHRPGQESTVYSLSMIAGGTVEKRIERAHINHMSMADTMKDAVQGFREALLEDAAELV